MAGVAGIGGALTASIGAGLQTPSAANTQNTQSSSRNFAAALKLASGQGQHHHGATQVAGARASAGAAATGGSSAGLGSNLDVEA